MKYLYLLGSVLRSHFDRNRRNFTLSVMLMFFFSSFLMLFAASVLGSSVLWSEAEKDQADTTYYFYMHEKHSNGTYYEREAVGASEYIFDTLFSLDSNSIDFISVSIFNDSETLEKLGEKLIQDISIMPVLKESYGEKLFFSMYRLNMDGMDDYYQLPCPSEQNIKEGSEITSQDLEEGKNVIVLPEDCGVKVGEEVALFGETFSVVGITTDEFVRIPSFALEKLSFEGDELKYVIRYIDFDKPMADKTYKALNQAVYELTGKEIVGYERKTFSNEADMAYLLLLGIFGTLIALFSVFGIYYPILRLCKETMPILSVFKLCGMRMLPVFGLLAMSILACYAVSFGLASVVLILTEGLFSNRLIEYELKDIYFGHSALLFILVAAVAIAPPMIKMAKSQPSEEVEN